MIIIGIAGGTGSGKTTVVKKIVEALPAGEVAVLPQDSYYKDSGHIPPEERQKINFDEPAAFEWELLISQLQELKDGHSIEVPTYSYITCTRQPETVPMHPRDEVVVDGTLLFSEKRLRDMMDIKVFVDADADDRLIRVINRDCIERGRTPELVVERYERVLKPMHNKYIEPAKKYADLIIPQGGNNTVAIKLLKEYIEGRINTRKE